MRYDKLGRSLFNLSVLLVPSYFLWSASGYGPQAKMVPLLIGLVVFLLQAWVTIEDLIPERIRVFRSRSRYKPNQNNADTEGPTPLGREITQAGMMSGWMLFFFVAISLLGFLLGILIFVLLFLVISGKSSWRFALVMSAGLTTLTWVTFVRWMKFKLFQGLLFGSFVSPL